MPSVPASAGTGGGCCSCAAPVAARPRPTAGWWLLRGPRPGATDGGVVAAGRWSSPDDLLAATATPEDAPATPPDGTAPRLLVCTHGRHDTCCAVRGRPGRRGAGGALARDHLGVHAPRRRPLRRQPARRPGRHHLRVRRRHRPGAAGRGAPRRTRRRRAAARLEPPAPVGAGRGGAPAPRAGPAAGGGRRGRPHRARGGVPALAGAPERRRRTRPGARRACPCRRPPRGSPAARPPTPSPSGTSSNPARPPG